MTPEERELLERTAELAEENNDMLRSMRRSMRISRIIGILYWVVIIGSAVGAYYFIQPYLELVAGAYGDARSTVDEGVGGINEILDTIRNFTN